MRKFILYVAVITLLSGAEGVFALTNESDLVWECRKLTQHLSPNQMADWKPTYCKSGTHSVTCRFDESNITGKKGNYKCD